MATRQSTVRLPDRSWEQVTELAKIFGDNTKVFMVAVDRLYQQEVATMTDRPTTKFVRVTYPATGKSEVGQVIQDGVEKSLVETKADPLSGASTQCDWLPNEWLTDWSNDPDVVNW